MKLPSLVATVVFSTLASAFAITDADIAPAALAGKTLTFTIVNGGAPYATTGTWSGTFSGTGTGFTVANITGDTVGISTTCTGTSDGGFTSFSLAKFVEGQKPATLTLYTIDGVGHYEVSIQDLFGVGLNGTFTFGAPPVVKNPEIAIQQPLGTNLSDGLARKSFGPVKVGKTSTPKTFTIKNTGKAKLTGLAINKTGANKAAFIVTAPGKTSLTPGESTTFQVTFQPAAAGTKNAAIHISSNDADESPFDIKLTGEALPK